MEHSSELDTRHLGLDIASLPAAALSALCPFSMVRYAISISLDRIRRSGEPDLNRVLNKPPASQSLSSFRIQRTGQLDMYRRLSKAKEKSVRAAASSENRAGVHTIQRRCRHLALFLQSVDLQLGCTFRETGIP